MNIIPGDINITSSPEFLLPLELYSLLKVDSRTGEMAVLLLSIGIIEEKASWRQHSVYTNGNTQAITLNCLYDSNFSLISL